MYSVQQSELSHGPVEVQKEVKVSSSRLQKWAGVLEPESQTALDQVWPSARPWGL